MKYTHILLDADDTLFDFKGAEHDAFSDVLRQYGKEPSEELVALYSKINDGYWKLFEKNEITLDELKKRRFVDFGEQAGIEGDVSHMGEDYTKLLVVHSRLLPGAQEFVRELHSMGLTLCITTNGIATVQHGRFDNCPISEYISGLFISQELGVQKPSVEYFKTVQEKLGGVSFGNMMIFGDSLRSDILGGLNVGMDTAWYNPKGNPAGDIVPKYIVSNYGELLEIIKNS